MAAELPQHAALVHHPCQAHGPLPLVVGLNTGDQVMVHAVVECADTVDVDPDISDIAIHLLVVEFIQGVSTDALKTRQLNVHVLHEQLAWRIQRQLLPSTIFINSFAFM